MLNHRLKYTFLFSFFFISVINAAEEPHEPEKVRLSWYLPHIAKDIVGLTPEHALDLIDEMEDLRSKFREDALKGRTSLIEDFDDTILSDHRRIAQRCIRDNIPFFHAVTAEIRDNETQTNLISAFLLNFAKQVSYTSLLDVTHIISVPFDTRTQKSMLVAMILVNTGAKKGKLLLTKLSKKDSAVDKSWGDNGYVEDIFHPTVKTLEKVSVGDGNPRFPITITFQSEPNCSFTRIHVRKDGKDVYWS
jgi:hypothetical protein